MRERRRRRPRGRSVFDDVRVCGGCEDRVGRRAELSLLGSERSRREKGRRKDNQTPARRVGFEGGSPTGFGPDQSFNPSINRREAALPAAAQGSTPLAPSHITAVFMRCVDDTGSKHSVRKSPLHIPKSHARTPLELDTVRSSHSTSLASPSHSPPGTAAVANDGPARPGPGPSKACLAPLPTFARDTATIPLASNSLSSIEGGELHGGERLGYVARWGLVLSGRRRWRFWRSARPLGSVSSSVVGLFRSGHSFRPTPVGTGHASWAINGDAVIFLRLYVVVPGAVCCAAGGPGWP